MTTQVICPVQPPVTTQGMILVTIPHGNPSDDPSDNPSDDPSDNPHDEPNDYPP